MPRLNRFVNTAIITAALLRAAAAPAADAPAFRPPAVPLVASDPYLSIWSEADRLTDDNPRHWTRKEHTIGSMIRVDGTAYRLMGKDPANVPAFPQTAVRVLPTRSIYDFENEQVHGTFTFLTPSLSHDMDVLARPVTYLTWQVRSLDGKPHKTPGASLRSASGVKGFQHRAARGLVRKEHTSRCTDSRRIR